MWVPVLGLAVVSLLALLVCPVPRVRQGLLTAATRFVQAALLAALGACGTFLVQPDAAPEWTRPLLAPAVGLIESVASSPAPAGLPWLVLAVLAVVATLPVLIALELAVGLNRQSRLVRSLRTDLRTTAAWVDSRLVALGLTRPVPPVSAETAAAAEALRGTGKTPVANEPLVIDLMK